MPGAPAGAQPAANGRMGRTDGGTSGGAAASEPSSGEDNAREGAGNDAPFAGMGTEIRVTAQGHLRGYAKFASVQLQEKEAKAVVVRALGNAIGKACTLSQIIKREVPGLCDNAHTGSVWVAGRSADEEDRQISMISILLSRDLNANKKQKSSAA
ncbi:unnamed protein product [Ostreobium quekettii]|uniref:DNA/RNA-binding protein Alba-like domain-containing protein n=1 Tax=Ostreobium quekettii TaxID=121088 RepID=A0A8S1J6D3_9CHLO|nr:unnamed protein product [Ostreobium quekettii]